MRIGLLAATAAAMLCTGAMAVASDSVPARLEAARAAHAKGDLARAAVETEAALADLHARIGKTMAEFMPKALAGWQADAPEIQGLAGSGGGISVSRAYTRDEASLNVSVIIDSPAVAAAAARIASESPQQGNARRYKLGTEEALMRWDSANRAGEVLVVLGGRALLQIEGDNLGSADPLTEAAKGWNVPALRKYLGL